MDKKHAKILHDVRWAYADTTNVRTLPAFKESLIGAYLSSLYDMFCDEKHNYLAEQLMVVYRNGCKAATYADAVEWLIEMADDADANEVEIQNGLINYLVQAIINAE
jgi:hypothetical protein